jgi:uncharacterized protein (DUF433 family)
VNAASSDSTTRKNNQAMATQQEIPIQPVDNPIICSPYDEPEDHWFYNEHGEATRPGHRRPAGYWYKTEKTAAGQRGLFLNEQRDLLDLVNLLREDVTGTRVPISHLFEYLESGETLDEFLRQFPSVAREQALAALELSKESLLASHEIAA